MKRLIISVSVLWSATAAAFGADADGQPAALRRAAELIDQYDVSDVRPVSPGEPRLPVEIWRLADDEVFAFADGAWRVTKVADSDNPLALLEKFSKENPDSPWIDEAWFQKASYYQLRQQFLRALAAYERVTSGARKAEAQRQRQAILQPGVRLGPTGVTLSGTRPKIDFTYRNTRAVEFVAWMFDFDGCLSEVLRTHPRYMADDFGGYLFKQQVDWQKYRGMKIAEWREELPDDPLLLTRDGSTSAPLATPGVYWVEASVAGGNSSKTLLAVSGVALVAKRVPDGDLLWLADARSGRGVAGAKIRVVERWDEEGCKVAETELQTDADGVAVMRDWKKPDSVRQAFVTMPDGRREFASLKRWLGGERAAGRMSESRYFFVTDQPVYRPGDEVKFRAWQRRFSAEIFLPPSAGEQCEVQVRHPLSGASIGSLSLTADDTGAVSGAFRIPDGTRDGGYWLMMDDDSRGAGNCAGHVIQVGKFSPPLVRENISAVTEKYFNSDGFSVSGDQTEYHPGDTARLTLAVSNGGGRALFSDSAADGELRDWRFVDVPAAGATVEAPIEQQRAPNFFTDATLVGNGKTFFSMREFRVTDPSRLLTLTLAVEPRELSASGTASVRMRVTDSGGNGVPGAVVTLRLVSKIFAPDRPLTVTPREFFYGPARDYISAKTSSSDYVFQPIGSFGHPNLMVYRGARRSRSADILPSFAPPLTVTDAMHSGAWFPEVRANADGEATLSLTLPPHAGEWLLQGFVITGDTRVADAQVELVITWSARPTASADRHSRFKASPCL